MGTRHVLVLDEGTTSTRAALFDDRSRVVANSALPLMITTRPDGRVEQDAAELWEASRSVLSEVVTTARDEGLDIAALAIAVQRTTTVFWDAQTGQPVAPVVNWQDTRAAARATELSAEWAGKAKTVTGWSSAPRTSASTSTHCSPRTPPCATSPGKGACARGHQRPGSSGI